MYWLYVGPAETEEIVMDLMGHNEVCAKTNELGDQIEMLFTCEEKFDMLLLNRMTAPHSSCEPISGAELAKRLIEL